MTDPRPEGPTPLTEIRVHGVGDHDYSTSLGLPAERTVNDWVQVAEPPPVPDHELRIINWSRSNRNQAGFLWYFAFPFTLANVAGHMTSSNQTGSLPGGGSALLRSAVVFVGLILTVSQLAWIVVLVETVLRYTALPAGHSLIPLAAASLLIGWMVYRRLTVVRAQVGQTDGLALLAAHIAAVAITGGLLAWLKPARVQWHGWPSVADPTGGTAHLDAMALWIAASTVLATMAAIVLAVRYCAAGKRRRLRAPGVTGGVLLIVAVLLMHTVTALVRMIVDNMLGYVTGLFGAEQTERAAGVGILLAYDNPREAGDSRLDLFPFLALIVVLTTVVAAAVVLVATRSPGLPPLPQGKAARGRWWHAVAAAAPRLIPLILPVATGLATAAVGAAVVLGEGRLGGPWLALAILVLQFAGAAVILVILLGQLRPVREVLGKVADVAGFWPVRHHPLAGASYRDAAVAGIGQVAARHAPHRLVLVAHSQGSAICAWLIAHAGEDGRTAQPGPHLVTAGSPLSSLYRRFFPDTFTPALFRGVAEGSASWVNFWRTTDPIGTPVPGADNRRLHDPREDGTVRSHSDYWTEPKLVEHVRRLSRQEPISGSTRSTGKMNGT
ncbi:hypothetical protein [Arthrobacter sp. H5]|uniref:hypothetical protein n=1 Tax=Arthrobacter sp. H5 TaxID=1267973 RepID=UPI000480D23F|nr:hypothetical protein [Arthrobacter sp. H5]